MSQPLLEIENVSKEFPGVKALDDISLVVNRGELMALLGENGAGKSTLVKILSGAYNRDSGAIRIGGRSLPKHYGPLEARNLGVAIIYQELSLLPQLTVAENIFLTKEPLRSKLLHTIDYANMNAQAHSLLGQLQADYIPVTARVRSLSMPERQMVEIAKALAVNCQVIIMDEPTTTLTFEETQRLFNVVKVLKEQDVTVIYISHRLDEIFQIADRATVLRDGRLVGTVNIQESSRKDIISMMTGRKMSDPVPVVHQAAGNGHAELLRVEHFSDGELIEDVSFQLYENEVLGLAGLVGSGRTELARMIFGADKKADGEVFLHGQKIEITSPGRARSHGVGYLSEDRKEQGLNLGLSIENNIVLSDLSYISRSGIVQSKALRDRANTFIKRLSIKGKPTTRAESLSGGNQQKVVISKWLHAGCKVLIFDEPTRGIDVGAKAEVHAIIRQFAEQGRGVIVISSEVDELISVCDRILVMSKGHLVHTIQRDQMTKDLVLQHVTRGHQ